MAENPRNGKLVDSRTPERKTPADVIHIHGQAYIHSFPAFRRPLLHAGGSRRKIGIASIGTAIGAITGSGGTNDCWPSMKVRR
jgi:hypothetical protein